MERPLESRAAFKAIRISLYRIKEERRHGLPAIYGRSLMVSSAATSPRIGDSRIAFKDHDLDPTMDERFRERHMGFSKAIHVTRFLNYFRMLGPRLTKPPHVEVEGGGESIAMVRRRVFDGLTISFRSTRDSVWRL